MSSNERSGPLSSRTIDVAMVQLSGTEAARVWSGATRAATGIRPDGEGIKPYYRSGLTVQWWAESGYCTRVAPSPSSEDDRRARWKVTHKDDGCGDGEAVME